MEFVIACKTCGLRQRIAELQLGNVAECRRCGSTISRRKSNSLDRTAAFSLAALIFYVPANVYPILSMDFYGVYSENTVWDGCVKLFESGQWPVALIVFCAGILIPLFKFLGILTLVATTRFKPALPPSSSRMSTASRPARRRSRIAAYACGIKGLAG